MAGALLSLPPAQGQGQAGTLAGRDKTSTQVFWDLGCAPAGLHRSLAAKGGYSPASGAQRRGKGMETPQGDPFSAGRTAALSCDQPCCQPEHTESSEHAALWICSPQAGTGAAGSRRDLQLQGPLN